MSSFPSSRRQFLKASSSGFGYLAFSALATQHALRAEENLAHPLAAKKPHFPAQAKRVIFLCMTGGPSHVDLFDYKPKLSADDGKEAPVQNGRPLRLNLLGSPWSFQQHGQSGIWMSKLLPELSKHADDLCVIHSMQTDVPAHPQAFVQMHTGNYRFVRPSMGAWTLYGLGTENENLPGFITINPTLENGGPRNYGSSFLPAICQGTPIVSEAPTSTMMVSKASDAPVQTPDLHLVTPSRRPPEVQRLELDLAQEFNRSRLQLDGGVNPEIEAAIASSELAFRMQTEAPGITDLSRESDATRALYGIGEKATDTFGKQCLLARRLVEAGVRFVEISCGDWDLHRKLKERMQANCLSMDKPVAGLLADLKGRGLLKDTLVIWGGEFGRTPHVQGNDGRDHNGKGFTFWLAGGGVKGGLTHGSTDDYGYEAVADPVHIHDWHATTLHLLGLDHEKLTFHYAGRDFRLTDMHGKVVKELLA
jgi:hypothetical protein